MRIGGAKRPTKRSCARFAAVEARARARRPLTYFEFGTLAAMWLFAERGVDVAVLEVGLGGRLDAVNAFDADCALVMSVDLDHMDYLGDTREDDRLREGRHLPRGPAGDLRRSPIRRERCSTHARRHRRALLLIGRDFGYERASRSSGVTGGRAASATGCRTRRCAGDYQLANAAACLAALDDAARAPAGERERHPQRAAARRRIPGRFQVLPGQPGGDPRRRAQSRMPRARWRENLARMPRAGRTFAVFAMLKDKDIDGVVAAVKRAHRRMARARDRRRRAAPMRRIVREQLARAGVLERVSQHARASPQPMRRACERAARNDRIVVFGSFHTVAAVMAMQRAGSDR